MRLICQNRLRFGFRTIEGVVMLPFLRDLMAHAERDLGTRLDWVAVDHWNT